MGLCKHPKFMQVYGYIPDASLAMLNMIPHTESSRSCAALLYLIFKSLKIDIVSSALSR